MNDNNRSIFKGLMDKYLSDAASPEEQAQLFRMIRKREYGPLLDRYIQAGFDVSAGMTASPEWERAFDARLQARIKANLKIDNQNSFTIRQIHPITRYAAAVLLFLVVAGTFYILQRGKPAARPAMAITDRHPDIKPGHNGAMLTLSNGRNIILDSAGNGLVATQGKTEIRKEDGRIIYAGNDNKELIYNSVTTTRGRQWSLVLPDGTKVRLNAATTLKYPAAFPGKKREVELNGEAYFEVAKNNDQPFVVKANNTEIKVLGTHFNIMAYGDEPALTTTLLEGSVAVSNPSGSRILTPGQQASIGQSTPITVISNVDVEKIMAWTTGFFKFDHTDIQSMMRQISRWYDIDIVYETEMKETDTYSGRINRNLDISDMITFLESNKIHRFRIEGKKLIVLP